MFLMRETFENMWANFYKSKVKHFQCHLRGDFLENRVFLAKSAQNLVTKPAEENPLAAIIFSSKFSKICENLKNFTGSLAT